jgi:hypothetical protein
MEDEKSVQIVLKKVIGLKLQPKKNITSCETIITIVCRRSEIRGAPHPFGQKNCTSPTLSKFSDKVKKSTKSSKKKLKLAKVLKST